MNEFKKKLKVDKEQLAYEEYKRQRFAKEIHKEKWDIARKKINEKERWETLSKYEKRWKGISKDEQNNKSNRFA